MNYRMSDVYGDRPRTTYSAVVLLLTMECLKIVKNFVGEDTTCALSSEEDGTVVIGRPVKQTQVKDPEECLFLIKRHIARNSR